MKNNVKVYSTVYLGQFTTGDRHILSLVDRISYDHLEDMIVEFRPLDEAEFNAIKGLAKKNKARVIYSSYDETLKGAVDMRVYDPRKEKETK